MDKFLFGLTAVFAKMPNRVLRSKRLVLVVLALVSIGMFYAMTTRTVFDLSSESFMQDESPAQIALDEFRRQFGSDRSVFIIYKPTDGDVFSTQSLTAMQQLTSDLENWQSLDRAKFPGVDLDQLIHIRRVKSLANIRLQESVGDALLSGRLLPKALPETAEDLNSFKARAMAQPDYVSSFYSKDGGYGGILVQTDFGTVPIEGYESAVDIAGVELDDSFSDFDVSFDEAAVIQEVEYRDVDPRDYLDFSDALGAVYGQYDEQLMYYPVGEPTIMSQMQDVLEQLRILGFLMVIIFAVLLWVLFRSASALVWSMVTITLSVAWCWGVTVLLGVTLSSMIALTILLIFSVGIADCVHVMSAYFSFRREGIEHYAALTKSYEKVGLAILLTTVTTAAGILVLATSNLEPIRIFALMCAFGVVLAFFFTIVLLPILLDLWHPTAVTEKGSVADRLGDRWHALGNVPKLVIALATATAIFIVLGGMLGLFINTVIALTYWIINAHQQILARVPTIVEGAPRLILAFFAIILALCIYGSTKIVIDTNISGLFKDDHPLAVAVNVVDNNMAGSQDMEVMIDTKTVDGMLDVDLLTAVDALQTSLEARYPNTIGRTYSLANIVKDTNQVMNDDNPEFYRIPNSNQAVSQLLYLFNSANPEDRRNLVSDDYSRSHIAVTSRSMGSFGYQQMFAEVELDIEARFAHLKTAYPDLEIVLTGTMATFMVVSDEIARSQFNGFALALVLISLIMIITLGSLRGGVMGMIPNAIPAFLAFGLMGLLGIPLDTDTLLIAPVILGIAVDDTIHFMTHYRVELTKSKSISIALESAIREVGQAVMFTTMVIGLGFAVLSFSDYLGMAKVGFFGSLSIFFALFCDLFLIPAMIIVFKPSFGVENVDTRIDFKGVTA
ncbi:MMPL family transporter [Porticoccaceae bacterium]|jgi:predicted RND superfamily exporter protein|nr:MMPL family transporter [Porticoccaceae bacterium]